MKTNKEKKETCMDESEEQSIRVWRRVKSKVYLCGGEKKRKKEKKKTCMYENK